MENFKKIMVIISLIVLVEISLCILILATSKPDNSIELSRNLIEIIGMCSVAISTSILSK